MIRQSQLFKREPGWLDGRKIGRRTTPKSVLSWLSEAGSLTSRLRSRCGHGFAVHVLAQRWAKPFSGEAAALGLPPARFALIREVVLQCSGQPLVLARTIIPARTLRGANRRLARLGNRPLGEVLFGYPDLQRTNFQTACVRAADWQNGVRGAFATEKAVWGRRSVYTVAGGKLLVCEFFLPAVLQRETMIDA